MKKVFLLILFSILLSITLYGKDYHISYTTSEDQSKVRDANMKITPVNGDTINVLITRDDGLELLNFEGVLSDDYIKIIPNKEIYGGYIYKLVGKLRGNLFLNDLGTSNLVVLVREI